jgi:hypothetical protein
MKLLDIVESLRAKGQKKNMKGGGDCFTVAVNYMIENGHDNKNLRVVHGIVDGHGSLHGWEFTHAWCEDGDNIIDNSNGKDMVIPKIIYYSIGNINQKECKYYDMNGVFEQIEKYGVTGPWEIENEVRPLPWNTERRIFGK